MLVLQMYNKICSVFIVLMFLFAGRGLHRACKAAVKK